VDGGNFLELAVEEVSAAAGLALEAVAAMPSHADSLAGLPLRDFGADRVNASGDLMAWHSRILKPWPEPFFHERVAVANAAGFDLDAYLTAIRLGRGALDQIEISTGLADLDGFHCRHG
jgi:hypothetical protein